MITFKTFILERFAKLKQNEFSDHTETRARFKELGIEPAFDLFIDWFAGGIFSPKPAQLARFENAFWAIRSVLPEDVLATYKDLPVVYMGFDLPTGVTKAEVKKLGFPIGSRIMSWAPKKLARQYKSFSTEALLLKHKPKQHEVVLMMNNATCKFLHYPIELVANHNEVILSTPHLRITPDMIAE